MKHFYIATAVADEVKEAEDEVDTFACAFAGCNWRFNKVRHFFTLSLEPTYQNSQKT